MSKTPFQNAQHPSTGFIVQECSLATKLRNNVNSWHLLYIVCWCKRQRTSKSRVKKGKCWMRVMSWEHYHMFLGPTKRNTSYPSHFCNCSFGRLTEEQQETDCSMLPAAAELCAVIIVFLMSSSERILYISIQRLTPSSAWKTWGQVHPT